MRSFFFFFFFKGDWWWVGDFCFLGRWGVRRGFFFRGMGGG